MRRTRNRKTDVEILTLGELIKSLSIKQLLAIMSMIVLACSTVYGYGYTLAQSRASTELTLHKIEDEKAQVEELKRQSEKDLEINKLRIENENLKDKLDSNQSASPPKQSALIFKVPKLNEEQ